MFPWHACLNHSCRPSAHISSQFNCFHLLSKVNKPIPRILSSCVYIIANRDIKQDEEITISYVDELTPSYDEYVQALTALKKTDPATYNLTYSHGLNDHSEAPSVDLIQSELDLSEAVTDRFGWDCLCEVCKGRLSRTSN